MSEKKGWGKKVLGWFVVDEEAPGNQPTSPDATEDLLAKYGGEEGTSTPVPAVPVSQVAVPTVTGVSAVPVDFAEVFSAGGVDASEQERMRKASELLNTLPADTPPAVKKQIVEASLRVFGFPIDTIIEAGVAEMGALEAFLSIGQTSVQKLITDSAVRIQQLEGEIADLRALVDRRVREQEGQKLSCDAKKLEIQQVLEFFGQEAVEKVVHESSRLHEPPPSS